MIATTRKFCINLYVILYHLVTDQTLFNIVCNYGSQRFFKVNMTNMNENYAKTRKLIQVIL